MSAPRQRWAAIGTQVTIRGQGRFAGQVLHSYVERVSRLYIVAESGHRFSTEYPYATVPRNPHQGYTVAPRVTLPREIRVRWERCTVPAIDPRTPRPRPASRAVLADTGEPVLTMLDRGSKWQFYATHDGLRLWVLPQLYRRRWWPDRDAALDYIGNRRGLLYVTPDVIGGNTPTPVARPTGTA